MHCGLLFSTKTCKSQEYRRPHLHVDPPLNGWLDNKKKAETTPQPHHPLKKLNRAQWLNLSAWTLIDSSQKFSATLCDPKLLPTTLQPQPWMRFKFPQAMPSRFHLTWWGNCVSGCFITPSWLPQWCWWKRHDEIVFCFHSIPVFNGFDWFCLRPSHSSILGIGTGWTTFLVWIWYYWMVHRDVIPPNWWVGSNGYVHPLAEIKMVFGTAPMTAKLVSPSRIFYSID